jgi:hypothetical protein
MFTIATLTQYEFVLYIIKVLAMTVSNNFSYSYCCNSFILFILPAVVEVIWYREYLNLGVRKLAKAKPSTRVIRLFLSIP